MGRKPELGSRVYVSIILTYEQLEKLDKIAGHGNRSNYIRWLIENSDGEGARKAMELEEDNKKLLSLIESKNREIERMKKEIERLRDKTGKGEEWNEMKSKGYERYKEWRRNLEENRIPYNRQMGLNWVLNIARELGMTKKKLSEEYESKFEQEHGKEGTVSKE
jgi:hypothetical protein